MCPDKNNLINREQKIKSKLVDIRSTIKKKFNKVYRDRIKREKKLNEKYRPITRAIDKLIKKNVHPQFGYDDAQDNFQYDAESNTQPQFSYDPTEPMDIDDIRNKAGRSRDDDTVDKFDKRSRSSQKVNTSDPKMLRKIKELQMARNIRTTQSHSSKQKKTNMNAIVKMSNESAITKRRRSSDDDVDEISSEFDEEHDILTQHTEPGKKSCLSKTDMDKHSDQARLKNNKKIIEMRKVDRILKESKETPQNETDYVEISS